MLLLHEQVSKLTYTKMEVARKPWAQSLAKQKLPAGAEVVVQAVTCLPCAPLA